MINKNDIIIAKNENTEQEVYPILLNKLLKYIIKVKEVDKEISIMDLLLEYSMRNSLDLELIGDAISTDEYFKNIVQKDMEVKLHSFGTKSEKINTILNSFYDTPILSVKDIVTRTGIADKTTRNMIELMLEEGLIKEMTGYGRNKLFIFEKYFNLFK